MTNTVKAFALALTLAAGMSALASPSFAATDGYHWAYAMEYVGK